MGYNYYVDTSYGLNAATSSISGAMLVFVLLAFVVGLTLSVFLIISMWKVFTKAGKPGWVAIIPGYNIYVMCEIANLPWWYILLFFIPIVNIYAAFKIYDGISKRFGRTTGFTIGLLFLPFVFFAILAFGKNEEVVDTEQDDMGVVQNDPFISETVDISVPQMPVIDDGSIQTINPGVNYQPQSNIVMPNNNVTGNINYVPPVPNMNQNNLNVNQMPMNNTVPQQPVVNNVMQEQVDQTGQIPTSYFAAHQVSNMQEQPVQNETVAAENIVNPLNNVNNFNSQVINDIPNNVVEPVIAPTYDAASQIDATVNQMPTFTEPVQQQTNIQSENPLSADNFVIDKSMTLDNNNDVNQNNGQM